MLDVPDLVVPDLVVPILEAMEALLLGASGLIGSELLRQLRTNRAFTKITIPSRHDLTRPLPPSIYPEVVFCCLGTTIKKAGSQEAFREIDHHMIIRVAREARVKGARHFVVVSAMGADPQSRIFYNRVKGEMETELKTLGYPMVTIIHPSLLLGDRKEFRLGERIAAVMMTVGSPLIPKKWKAVKASEVAKMMMQLALKPGWKSEKMQGERVQGCRVVENAEIGG